MQSKSSGQLGVVTCTCLVTEVQELDTSHLSSVFLKALNNMQTTEIVLPWFKTLELITTPKRTWAEN